MATMTPKTLTLLLVGLACLGGAALLRSQTAGTRDLEPIDRATLERLASPSASAEATKVATSLPVAGSATPVVTASAAPKASASPSGSPKAGASASPSAGPSISASASALEAALLAGASPSAKASASASSSATPSPKGPTPKPGTAAALHAQAVVVDTHIETPLWLVESKYKLRSNKGQTSLDKLKAGGVDVVFFSIFVNPAKYGVRAKYQAEVTINTLKKEIAANADLIELATSYADIQRIVAKGKIAGLMGMEGGEPLGNVITNVDHFYKLGVRYLGPTWSLNNQLGDSAGVPTPRWKGLSPLGKQVVKRMNQLNMLVDVSHLSDAAFYDVLKISTQPVIASHSGVDGARVSPRNLSNDMLKLLSVNGGVVGVLFYPPFLVAKGKADVAAIVNHIDYAVKVGGIDHVGLGSDFDGLDTPPPVGLKDSSQFPAITAELKKRGYKDAEILKILGGNFMKVFEQVLK